LLALGLAQLDHLKIIGQVFFDLANGGDFLIELRALAHQRLRLGGVVPKGRVFGEGV
jgi:hypothetical protein